MNKCPNKSSEEWKLLVNIYGEAFATTLYEKNGEEIPDLETAQKLFSNLATLASNPGGIKSSPGTSSPKIDSKIVLKAIKNQQDNPYPTVREALVRQYSQLIRRLSNVRDQQRSTTDKEKRHQLSIKYADLSERLKKVKETLDSYKEVQNLDELTLILDSMVLNAQEILNLPELSHDDIEEAGRILNLLSLAGDFSSDIGGAHLIFSKEELESEALKYGYVDDNGTFHKGYSQYKEVADELNRKLNSIKENYIVTTVQKQLNNPKLTKQQIFGALRDINYATARTLDGSDVNDAMVQTMYSLLNQSTIAAEMETRDRLATLEGLLKKTKQYGSFKEIFAQKYKDGKLTGDLVSRFTPEFFDAKSLAREKAKALNGKLTMK